jgi:hypothetical protein
VNADVARQLAPRVRLTLEVFNLFNARVSDIDYYYYTSRLPGEPPSGVPDTHTHPALPRSVRLAFAFTF